MRTVGSMLAALLLSGPAVAQRSGIDVKSYWFFVTLPDSGREIHVAAVVTFEHQVPGDSVLALNLVGMTIDSVKVLVPTRGGLSREFTYDGRVLRIPLRPQPATIIAVVGYHGTPQDGLIIGSNARGRRVAFADNWPERGRFWLPTVDRPSDKAMTRFSIRAPAVWRVVANGKLTPGEGGREWDESHPIPTYTMVIGAGAFTVSKHRPVINGRDTIPIQVWTYPEDSAFADSIPFRRATEIVEVMQRLIGPFPYENLKHVESSTRFGGMENASAIFYAEKPYVERRMGEGVVRHETAHQWFGDAVTERDWHHLWLSEGFASYFDLVIGATLDGDSVLRTGMGASAESYFRSNVVDRAIIDTAEHDLMKLLNANNYQKGSWVLHMLRGLVGDSAFFRGIRDYYGGRRDSTALSADFERVMEKASKQDLDWFFRQWLYQPGYPQLECSWSYDSGAKRVTLELTQAQPASWGVFRLPRVAVDFPGFDGSVTRRSVSVVGRAMITTLDLPGAPADVRIDPDGALLLRANVRRRSG